MHTCFALNVGPDASVHDEILDVYPNADDKSLELLECMALTFLALHGVSRIQELGRTEMIELFDNFAAIISTTVSYTRPHAGLLSRTKGLCGAFTVPAYPPHFSDIVCPVSFDQAKVQVVESQVGKLPAIHHGSNVVLNDESGNMVSHAGASGAVIDREIGHNLRSQAPTDENVARTKPTSETRIRAGNAHSKMKETELARKKVAKLGGCTAEESMGMVHGSVSATHGYSSTSSGVHHGSGSDHGSGVHHGSGSHIGDTFTSATTPIWQAPAAPQGSLFARGHTEPVVSSGDEGMSTEVYLSTTDDQKAAR